MTTITRPLPTRPGLGRHLRDRWALAVANHQRRREARRMRDTLSSLNDDGLRDLGLHRCEIDSVVAETHMPAEQRRPRVGPL